ncbi:MAG TPA: head-tail adaptor protein, partial [Thermomicrobiales bacterium]|nr:head-tail adaptor protein [Thermomicrobiales bacterium]
MPGAQTGVDRLNRPVYADATWRAIFAEVLPVRGAEATDRDGEQIYSESIYRFNVDYYEAYELSATDVLRFENQEYDIINLRPDHHRKTDTIIEAVRRGGVN